MSSGCCATCVHFNRAQPYERHLMEPVAAARREDGAAFGRNGRPQPQLPADWVDFSAWTGGPGDGWCWWLTAHHGMLDEVPIWMLRPGVLDGERTRRVPMNMTLGADCRQWQARLTDPARVRAAASDAARAGQPPEGGECS